MGRVTSGTRATLAALAAVLVAVACGSTSTAGPGGTDVGSGHLLGAGATFPKPFYDKAFFDYTAMHPQVTVNYPGGGSGAGIQQFINNTVDFGASDVPMGASDIASAGGASVLTQIPTTLGVISIAYNLSGVDKLQLDGPTLAGIYLLHITKWNDPAIAALNPGVNLPNTVISAVHRSDGSGTTYHFTDYLGKVSAEWKTSVGVSKSVSFPKGSHTPGAQGNANVAQTITQIAGAVGYVELAYVVQANMHQAFLKNANGKFVQASVEGATAAAAQNTSVSPTNFSIANEPGDTTYPIAGFSWVILRTTYDAAKGKAIVYLFKWLVTDGQADGTALKYAPLPPAVQQLAITNLKAVHAGGQQVLS